MTRASVTLGSAPFLLNHHLQRVERVFAGSVPIFPGNDALLQELSETFGAAFTVVPASSYGDDPWIQDELEFPTATAPGARRLDLVIDSVRDRGLDPFAERELAGPGVAVRTWGSPEAATTWDGLGNLETTPALSVAGRDFPFGRIYYGTGLAPELVQALQEQTLQLPFALDVSWLCVGHVDEVVSFVPDSSSPKGFKLLISHVPSAYALLDALPQSLLPRYYSNFGYWSLQTLLSDAVLRELNLALQQDELDLMEQRLMQELGLEVEDIIHVPALFETVAGCEGRVSALIPNLVNVLVASLDGQHTHVFLPDPFVRAVEHDQDSDPLIQLMRRLLPSELSLHFVDNWYPHHLTLGGMHCATNTQRAPQGEWWNQAQPVSNVP